MRADSEGEYTNERPDTDISGRPGVLPRLRRLLGRTRTQPRRSWQGCALYTVGSRPALGAGGQSQWANVLGEAVRPMLVRLPVGGCWQRIIALVPSSALKRAMRPSLRWPP